MVEEGATVTIPDAIRQLLAIVEQLHRAYPKKAFTLDGRLVGDIGEILVEAEYDVVLFDGLEKHHDARAADGRLVQIKATMKRHLTFPADHVPDYYLGIRIDPDGRFEEVFNGPGAVAAQAVRARKRSKTNLHAVAVSTLSRLNAGVAENDRIPRRSQTSASPPR